MDKEFNVLKIKLKDIISNINSYINISKKIKIINSKENISLETQNENNLVLLKTLEIIIDIILEKDRKYKEDNKYKKVKSENDNIKFETIRKKQLSIFRKNEREKNKRILEYHRKTRFYHLNKNGINLNFYKNIRNNMSILSEEDLINEKIRNKKQEVENLLFFN